VPPRPGAWSALGCLMVDIRHDLSTMYLHSADAADPEELEEAFVELEREGERLLSAEGVAPGRIRLERSIAMRYLGQWRSMDVAVQAPIVDLDGAVEQFHRDHEREFSYRRDDAPVELYRLQLVATGATEDVRLPRHDADADAELPEPAERRPVWFEGDDEPRDTPVFAREDLPAGLRFEGPAVIDQLDTTTLVPPGVRAEVDEYLNIRMEVR
jgi:N-methylhydantoinase A